MMCESGEVCACDMCECRPNTCGTLAMWESVLWVPQPTTWGVVVDKLGK